MEDFIQKDSMKLLELVLMLIGNLKMKILKVRSQEWNAFKDSLVVGS